MDVKRTSGNSFSCGPTSISPGAAIGCFARVEVAPRPVAPPDVPARPTGLIEIALANNQDLKVAAANLWHFARRPLDLDWLVRFWQGEGRLGSLAEMVERSVSERLRETNTGRARSDAVDSANWKRVYYCLGRGLPMGIG